MEIKREQYINQLIRKRDNGRVKIITGIRRCGKSYLLFHLYKQYLLQNGVSEEQIIEMPLDEIDNVRYRNPFELNEYIKGKIKNTTISYYVFIDEIQFSIAVPNPYVQNAEEKVTFIDTVLGLMKYPNVDIYVTGSNSKMLSREVLTQFRDRGDEIHLYPLSYAEIYPCYADKRHVWRDYCTFGGMPYILSLETTAEKSKYLKDLFEETYIKDLIERNKLKNNKEVLEILLDFISSSIGSLTNPAKLARRFASEQKVNVSHNTIARYMDYLEEAYIVESAKRYDIKGSAYFSTPLKYYFTDIGLRNARLNFRQIEETHIMENIIFNDLVRRGYNVDVGVVQTFQKRKDKITRIPLEVDFVVNAGNQRYYIQAAFRIEDEQKREQEVNSLKRINDSFKKIVIVRDDIIPWQDEKGISYMGVQDFLLSDNPLEASL